ncbi:hypothetical protein D3C72_1355050 [compost metagenome]
MARDAPEGQSHQREGQEGNAGQAPVHAQQHDAEHHQQGQGAVEAGQHGFACGHFDGVDVVRRQRHQVTRALVLVKRRALLRHARVEARAQHHAQLVGGLEQGDAPAHAQEVDDDADGEQGQQLKPQFGRRHTVRGQRVDDGAHAARDPDGQCCHACQHDGSGGIRRPMLTHEAGDEPR